MNDRGSCTVSGDGRALGVGSLTKTTVTTVKSSMTFPCLAVSSACRRARLIWLATLLLYVVARLACLAMCSVCLRADWASDKLACCCFSFKSVRSYQGQ